MNWQLLLNTNRFGQASTAERQVYDLRSEFQRDYDRIIFSSPFRRLQNKTQVFPLPGSVFVHNRLTHSLEVASVGRSLGNIVFSKIKNRLSPQEQLLVREIDTVVATACLAHDLGNPPFGHSGEKAVSHFFASGPGKAVKQLVSDAEYADLTTFEGNANLIRLLTHQFAGRRKGGYALTYASLGAMIKYPWASVDGGEQKKYGYFQSEQDTFPNIMNSLGIPALAYNPEKFARHPLVYLVEAADDICYLVMDLEDAFKLKIVSYDKIEELFFSIITDPEGKIPEKIRETMPVVTDLNERVAFLRAMTINKLTQAVAGVFDRYYEAIMAGSFNEKLFRYLDDHTRQSLNDCARFSQKHIYNNPQVVKIEISGYNVIGALLDEFFAAVMNPYEDYSRKILTLMPDQFKAENSSVYESARSVVDFISGMTDVFAVDLFKMIKGIEL